MLQTVIQFPAPVSYTHLDVYKRQVYELIKRGELESSKIGKQLRVSEEQLTQYLNRSSSGNSESGQDIPYTFVNFEPESS